MTAGYVYVLSNPSMPGLVKIGRSINDPQIRAQQLYTTGVPEPFVLEFVFYTPDCERLEESIHENFYPFRKSGREFFEIEAEEVICWLLWQEFIARNFRHEVIDPIQSSLMDRLRTLSYHSKLPIYQILDRAESCIGAVPPGQAGNVVSIGGKHE